MFIALSLIMVIISEFKKCTSKYKNNWLFFTLYFFVKRYYSASQLLKWCVRGVKQSAQYVTRIV